MDTMNKNFTDPDDPSDDDLDTAILDTLRRLDCAHAGPSEETDATVLSMAKSRMALILSRPTIETPHVAQEIENGKPHQDAGNAKL